MANRFCVSLTHAKDNQDKSTVAFVVANAAVGSGKETLVFLSVEGVRLAQKGYADDIREEGFAPLPPVGGGRGGGFCVGRARRGAPPHRSRRARAQAVAPPARQRVPVPVPAPLPQPAPAPAVRPLSVMGIGSWPRPRWMLQAIHEHLEGRLGESEFHATGDDAVRLAVDAQLRAGADVITDGEQRRDNYASYVGGRLDNCQLIPLTDLLPLVDDPEKFEKEMRSLDVPASEVRHPALFGPLGRSRALTGHEHEFVRTLTDRPVKIALPGPYLLTRLLWLECVSDRVYRSREHLAEDVVRVLREELHFLLAAGGSLVQLHQPVLAQGGFTRAKSSRSFMCGAPSEKGDPRPAPAV